VKGIKLILGLRYAVKEDQSMKHCACAVTVPVVGTKGQGISYNSVPLIGIP